MLLHFSLRRARHHDGKDDFIHQPFVMNIGSGNVHSQRRTTSIHQDMNLTASLGSVNRTFTGILPAQRSRSAFAVNGLPSPCYPSSSPIEAHKLPHQTLENPLLLPFLEARMECATAYPKPLSMHRFPLATRPQHIPYPIDDPSVTSSLASRPLVFLLWRQKSPQASPQRTWHSKIIHLLWFLGMILAQDVSVLLDVWRLQSERDTSSFSSLSPIYG